MWCQRAVVLLVLLAQAYSAPQFITFKDGKLGVNFGGYHAGVGLGGLLGGGAGGGLFAEAGTPHGQSARAGLGGAVQEDGRAAGALYAGATAGGNVKAEAGLAGKVDAEDAAGNGFAMARAGGHQAVSGLAGESTVGGSAGITFSGTKSIHVPTTVVKRTEVSVEPIKHKKVHTQYNLDSINEISPVVAGPEIVDEADVQETVVVKEIEPETQTVHKHHKVHTHSRPGNEFHKTAYIGGYIGAGADVVPQPAIVHKTLTPTFERRIDTGSSNFGTVDTSATANVGIQKISTKEISRNSHLFQDIFEIPISALKAVSSFLTNAADNTSISVQKSATFQAGGVLG